MSDWSWLVTLAVGLLGGGGLSALWRARGQNRTDERTQLSTEQLQFREHMRAEIARLDERSRNLETRNQALEERVLTLTIQNENQAHQIKELTEDKEASALQLKMVSGQKDFLERENNELRRENLRLRERLPTRTEVTE
jgi:HD-GYP domain-containing protein (c-di-GMP phosphodiesterase class II)